MGSEILECRKTDCGRFAVVFFNIKKKALSSWMKKKTKTVLVNIV